MRVSRICGIVHPDDGWATLAACIVVQAAEDLEGMLSEPRKNAYQIHALVQWFHGDWAREIMGTTEPDVILNEIYRKAGRRPLPLPPKPEIDTESGRKTLLTHDGCTMDYDEWAAATGIERRTLWARINEYGWPVGRALTTPPPQPVYITHLGESHTAKEWAQLVGVPANVITRRIRDGWSVDDALFVRAHKSRKVEGEVNKNVRHG